MDDDMLIKPQVHHEVAPSGETSPDGGGYSFVFHDRLPQGEEDEEEAKKQEEQAKKKAVKGPAVKLNLSSQALRKTTSGKPQDVTSQDPLEHDPELEKNTHVGPTGGRLNIKV